MKATAFSGLTRINLQYKVCRQAPSYLAYQASCELGERARLRLFVAVPSSINQDSNLSTASSYGIENLFTLTYYLLQKLTSIDKKFREMATQKNTFEAPRTSLEYRYCSLIEPQEIFLNFLLMSRHADREACFSMSILKSANHIKMCSRGRKRPYSYERKQLFLLVGDYFSLTNMILRNSYLKLFSYELQLIYYDIVTVLITSISPLASVARVNEPVIPVLLVVSQ